MADTDDVHRAGTACSVRISPDLVDADGELTLQAIVSCTPSCDLRGHAMLIKDDGGADLTRLELTGFDGVANHSERLAVKVPVNPGAHTWLVFSPAVVKNGLSYPEATAVISFTVKPHATNVVVWGVPSAIVVGERFSVKVGVKCAHECSLAEQEVEIRGEDGTPKERGTLSDDQWPGTSALYVAEVELDAPSEEGFYTWTVTGPSIGPGAAPSESATPHAEGCATFGVTVVTHPECVVTVEAVDQATQSPLTGARVVMHPYKAVTDERGIAQVRVSKGAYTLFVSQTRYLTFGVPVEVAADVTARAELSLEPVAERN